MTEPSPYQDEIDETAAGELPATDPNVACADHGADGVVDHEQHLGGFVDDDDATAADAQTATLEPDLDGDDEPDEPGEVR